VTTDSSASATILVVDDESALLRLLARVLEKAGHTVLTAMDGAEAISVFDEHCDLIDVVILDVNIPPQGIHEVFVHMIEVRSDLAPILSSGDVLDSNLRDELEAHGGTFLRKPFVPKALLSVVTRTLEASERGRAATANREGP
jgi:two-component system cell cycle sensor histidine kinase/response regulator CckA